ncbi:MAG: vitamin K epoxide reductase family protein [Chloroflexota bacterium]|nr:vitamin K epoxide reductase family protein [Chloroflexota bacterium]
MNPTQLSHELRNETTPDLTRRRWIVGLSIVGAMAAKLVSLYQVGILRNLPDPPIEVFDSARVDAAPYAYSRLNAPDGPLMLISYGATALLASMGGKERARRTPLVPLLMTLKIAGDVVLALQLAREEWRDTKALCFYCQIATVASLVSLGLALPETVRAIQTVRDDDTSLANGYGKPSLRERMREIVVER